METTTVSTAGANTLLPAMRSLLAGADEALLCVAFVSEAGVNLIRPQLQGLGPRSRLLVTTTFATTTPAALATARDLGTEVRVLNPSGGTYHPKLFVTTSWRESGALIGSSNLTGGLLTNIEVASLLRGRRHEGAIAEAWEHAEALWGDRRAEKWTPEGPIEHEVLSKELHTALSAAVAANHEFWTLGASSKRNVVTEITPTGLYVETAASRAKGRPPQLVPAWMLQLAWDYLRGKGELSNKYLLADHGLNVKRSSAVCAILARLPGVTVRPGQSIVLEWMR